MPLRIIPRTLIQERPWITNASAWVREKVGVDGVCEPCALLATFRGRLILPKTALNGVTVAIVEETPGLMRSSGKLYLVSVGPGSAELIPPLAETALRASEVIVGYELYLTWIRPWIDGKEIHAPALTHERERASLAIEQARNGRVVSLVSSGDIGVYGMAALVLEEMVEEDRFELAVIPGISAATSCASLLGSPLSHDFATLSLSDLLCPWDWIEHRARQLARADLVVALYNVQSKTRQEGVYRILRLFLEEKARDDLVWRRP